MADERDANASEAPTQVSAANADDLTRGQFLTKASLGVGAVMAGMIAVPVAGMALTPAIKGRKFTAVKLGNVDDFPNGKFVKVVLEPDPDSSDAYVKKRTAYVRFNEDESVDTLAPPGQVRFSVVSNRCAHLGCPVQNAGTSFVCPCHGGAYDQNGKRTAGPPVRPLDRFEWELRGDELWAVDEYSLTQHGGKQVKLHGPGQQTDSPLGLLYPLQP